VEESSRRRFARYVHVKNWNLLFYCSNIAKSENAMLWRMLSRLETCIVYCCIWTVTLAKSIVPRKTWRKVWHSYISKLFLTKMQDKFSIFFHRGSLNVIGDKFRYVRSKKAVNFLVFLLEEIGSDRAHCECMRRFASFVNCFLQNW
jgi:hypothetical protein